MDRSISNVGLKFEGAIDMKKFQMFLSTLVGDPETASEFLRIKGVLNIQGSDNMFVLQCVHMLKNQNFTYEWDPDQPRENRIIFIGRGMEARRHVLTEDMMSCVAKKL